MVRFKLSNNSIAALGVFAIILTVAGVLASAYFIGKSSTDAERQAQSSEESDRENIACRVTIRYGHIGDIKTDYYVAESGDECKELIEYTDKLPDDTPIYENNLGL